MSLFIKIIEVKDEHIVGTLVANNKKCYLDPTKISVTLEIGDEFYHIEHRFYDLYDKNNQLKLSLVKLSDLMLNT